MVVGAVVAAAVVDGALLVDGAAVVPGASVVDGAAVDGATVVASNNVELGAAVDGEADESDASPDPHPASSDDAAATANTTRVKLAIVPRSSPCHAGTLSVAVRQLAGSNRDFVQPVPTHGASDRQCDAAVPRR